jgi:hypothetical protein
VNNGYIKLFRAFHDWYGYGSSKRVHLWIELLLLSTHKEIPMLFSGKPILLKPGQFITGRKSLSATTKISESYIEDLLNEFEEQGQIQQQKTNTSRLITIVKWEDYQCCDNGEDNGEDNKKTTERQRSDTNKNDKNVKNEKKVTSLTNSEFFKDAEFVTLWDGWLESRKKMRVPNTNQSLNLAINKMTAWGLEKSKDALRQAIERGWRGIFEPKLLNLAINPVNSFKVKFEAIQKDYRDNKISLEEKHKLERELK